VFYIHIAILNIIAYYDVNDVSGWGFRVICYTYSACELKI